MAGIGIDYIINLQASAENFNRGLQAAGQAWNLFASRIQQGQSSLWNTTVLGFQLAIAGDRMRTALVDAAVAANVYQVQMTSFQRSAQIANVSADEAGAAVERLANRYKVLPQAVAQSMQLLFRRGFQVPEAEAMLERFADAGATIGKDLGESMQRGAEAVLQERSVLLNAIGIPENFIVYFQKLAKELGVSADALTEAQKRQAMYNLIMESTADRTGTAILTLIGFRGQLSALNANFQAFLRDFGVGVGAVFGPFVQLANGLISVLNALPPILSQVIGGLTALATVAAVASGVLFLTIANVMRLASTVQSTMANAIVSVEQAVSAFRDLKNQTSVSGAPVLEGLDAAIAKRIAATAATKNIFAPFVAQAQKMFDAEFATDMMGGLYATLMDSDYRKGISNLQEVLEQFQAINREGKKMNFQPWFLQELENMDKYFTETMALASALGAVNANNKKLFEIPVADIIDGQLMAGIPFKESNAGKIIEDFTNQLNNLNVMYKSNLSDDLIKSLADVGIQAGTVSQAVKGLEAQMLNGTDTAQQYAAVLRVLDQVFPKNRRVVTEPIGLLENLAELVTLQVPGGPARKAFDKYYLDLKDVMLDSIDIPDLNEAMLQSFANVEFGTMFGKALRSGFADKEDIVKALEDSIGGLGKEFAKAGIGVRLTHEFAESIGDVGPELTGSFQTLFKKLAVEVTDQSGEVKIMDVRPMLDAFNKDLKDQSPTITRSIRDFFSSAASFGIIGSTLSGGTELITGLLFGKATRATLAKRFAEIRETADKSLAGGQGLFGRSVTEDLKITFANLLQSAFTIALRPLERTIRRLFPKLNIPDIFAFSSGNAALDILKALRKEAGQTQTLVGGIINTASSIGSALGGMTILGLPLKDVGNFFKNIGLQIKGWLTTFNTFLRGLWGIGPVVGALNTLFSRLAGLLASVSAIFATFISSVPVVGLLISALLILFSMPGSRAGTVNFFAQLFDGVKAVGSAVWELISLISSAVGWLVNLGGIGSSAASGLGTSMIALGGIIGGVLKAVAGLVKTITFAFENVGAYIAYIWSYISTAAKATLALVTGKPLKAAKILIDFRPDKTMLNQAEDEYQQFWKDVWAGTVRAFSGKAEREMFAGIIGGYEEELNALNEGWANGRLSVDEYKAGLDDLSKRADESMTELNKMNKAVNVSEPIKRLQNLQREMLRGAKISGQYAEALQAADAALAPFVQQADALELTPLESELNKIFSEYDKVNEEIGKARDVGLDQAKKDAGKARQINYDYYNSMAESIYAASRLTVNAVQSANKDIQGEYEKLIQDMYKQTMPGGRQLELAEMINPEASGLIKRLPQSFVDMADMLDPADASSVLSPYLDLYSTLQAITDLEERETQLISTSSERRAELVKQIETQSKELSNQNVSIKDRENITKEIKLSEEEISKLDQEILNAQTQLTRIAELRANSASLEEAASKQVARNIVQAWKDQIDAQNEAATAANAAAVAFQKFSARPSEGAQIAIKEARANVELAKSTVALGKAQLANYKASIRTADVEVAIAEQTNKNNELIIEEARTREALSQAHQAYITSLNEEYQQRRLLAAMSLSGQTGMPFDTAQMITDLKTIPGQIENMKRALAAPAASGELAGASLENTQKSIIEAERSYQELKESAVGTYISIVDAESNLESIKFTLFNSNELSKGNAELETSLIKLRRLPGLLSLIDRPDVSPNEVSQVAQYIVDARKGAQDAAIAYIEGFADELADADPDIVVNAIAEIMEAGGKAGIDPKVLEDIFSTVIDQALSKSTENLKSVSDLGEKIESALSDIDIGFEFDEIGNLEKAIEAEKDYVNSLRAQRLALEQSNAALGTRKAYLKAESEGLKTLIEDNLNLLAAQKKIRDQNQSVVDSYKGLVGSIAQDTPRYVLPGGKTAYQTALGDAQKTARESRDELQDILDNYRLTGEFPAERVKSLIDDLQESTRTISSLQKIPFAAVIEQLGGFEILQEASAIAEKNVAEADSTAQKTGQELASFFTAFNEATTASGLIPEDINRMQTAISTVTSFFNALGQLSNLDAEGGLSERLDSSLGILTNSLSQLSAVDLSAVNTSLVTLSTSAAGVTASVGQMGAATNQASAALASFPRGTTQQVGEAISGLATPFGNAAGAVTNFNSSLQGTANILQQILDLGTQLNQLFGQVTGNITVPPQISGALPGPTALGAGQVISASIDPQAISRAIQPGLSAAITQAILATRIEPIVNFNAEICQSPDLTALGRQIGERVTTSMRREASRQQAVGKMQPKVCSS